MTDRDWQRWRRQGDVYKSGASLPFHPKTSSINETQKKRHTRPQGKHEQHTLEGVNGSGGAVGQEIHLNQIRNG